jgi:catechol 2,3-dioxygenase-like lactoylglutathione lyase family enzyme
VRLNHINLPVADVAADRDFYTKYFEMVTVHEVGNNFLAILQDDDGMVLNLSHFDKNSTDQVQYHRDFHIGFFVDTNEEVDSMHARIADGIPGVQAPKKREGRYGFYVTSPGGIVTEVACLKMDVPN